MTQDRRRQIEAVMLEALARAAGGRAAYLDGACAGDADLRREVESLLAGQSEAAAMLESPPWAAPAAPPLAPGTRLGPYEITAAIGAGGMGDVYKARDTRLGRTVAIKVLPPALAADPERRRRFEHEARAASALNHPHICPLFDVGEAVLPSPEPRALHFLVLAYLDGQTLAARLTKGPLPVPQALDLGAQIADALSAAHRGGIVHRDLKPANVMLTKVPAGEEGKSSLHAMLLDFGLAKLTGHGERPALDADGVTASASLTERGLILGTVPYMAPEQVEGKAADARTDLWALGAVLYEMVTGRRAFEGETPTKVAAAILEHEPASLAWVQPQAPPVLARLIAKCLAKDPDNRWDTAHDVADELRWIAQTSGAGVLTTVQLPRRRVARLVLIVAGGLAMGVAGAGLMWVLRPAPGVSLTRPSLDVRPAEELNAGGLDPISLRTPGGSRTALTWTVDGQALVFVGRRGGVQQLYVRRLDAAEARPLAGTEGAQVPAVSADGTWVAFWAAGAIRKIPLGGGPVMDLATGITSPPYGLVWDAGDRVFFGRDDERIWQIPPDGAPTPVTTVGEAEFSHCLPWPLPGERALLYTVRKRMWSWGDEEIVAHIVATGERRVLLRDAADARYVPTGHLVFLRRGTLFAVRFDAERLKVQSAPVAVLDTVVQALTGGNSGDATGAGQFAFAPAGTLAWIQGSIVPHSDAALVTVNRRGQVEPLGGPIRGYGPGVRVSPDGRQVAVTIKSLTERGLWLYNVGRGTLTPLAGGAETGSLVWAPDGRRLLFAWRKDGRRSLVAQPSDGTVQPQVLLAGAVLPSSWARDGRQLAAVRGSDVIIVTVEGGKARTQPLFETPHNQRWPEFSPDGRWLAYGSDVSGRTEVYVRPYPGPGPVEQVSVSAGASPAWNPNGKEVFFLGPPNAAGLRPMMAVDFEAGAPPRIGPPTPLFEFDQAHLPLSCIPVRCYDVAPDGQRFYATQVVPAPPQARVTHINLIPNWLDELKAKVAVR